MENICARIYGKEFAYRPKKGFPLPLQDWLAGNAGFKNYTKNIFDNNFLLNKKIDHLEQYLGMNDFDNKLLDYGDSERIWVKWFLMVIRTAQDVFCIKDIQ